MKLRQLYWAWIVLHGGQLSLLHHFLLPNRCHDFLASGLGALRMPRSTVNTWNFASVGLTTFPFEVILSGLWLYLPFFVGWMVHQMVKLWGWPLCTYSSNNCWWLGWRCRRRWNSPCESIPSILPAPKHSQYHGLTYSWGKTISRNVLSKFGIRNQLLEHIRRPAAWPKTLAHQEVSPSQVPFQLGWVNRMTRGDAGANISSMNVLSHACGAVNEYNLSAGKNIPWKVH